MTSPIKHFFQRPTSALKRSGGFAHLAALLVALLLSTVAATFVVQSRTASLEVRAHIDLAQARHSADAGIRYMIAELSASSALGRDVVQWKHADFDVRIVATDLTGRLNINRASAGDIQALLAQKGRLSQTQAMAITEAIMRYRELDGLSLDPMQAPAGQGGRVLGMSRDVDSRVFDSVPEVMAVPGITPALYALIKDHITVYGGGESASSLGSAENGQPTYHIEALAERSGDVRFMRTAIVSLSPSRNGGVTVYRWN